MLTKTIEFFQTDGADETLEAAKEKFAKENPETFIAHLRFVAASPGDRNGRWVEIEVTYC